MTRCSGGGCGCGSGWTAERADGWWEQHKPAVTFATDGDSRPDIVEIVQLLADLRPDDLSLTTNGMRLTHLAHDLRAAGLDRLTISCDSLREDRFARITRGWAADDDRDAVSLQQLRDGIDAATDAGFDRLKFNVVVIGGVNDDEVADFAALTINQPWTVRFIEYMPLGDSELTDEPKAFMLDNQVVKQRIESMHGKLHAVERQTEIGVGPADIFRLEGAKGRIGFISAMSQPFCETCNRLRLTATGELRSCLFDGGEVDIRPLVRGRHDSAALRQAFVDCVRLKPDRHQMYGNRQMSRIGG